MINYLPTTGAWVSVCAASKEAGGRVCYELCTQVATTRNYGYVNVSSRTAAEALEILDCGGWEECVIDLGNTSRFWFDDQTMGVFRSLIEDRALIMTHSPERTAFDDAFVSQREEVNAAYYLSMRDRVVKLAKKFASQNPSMVEQVGSDIEIQWPDGAVVGLYEDGDESGVYTRNLSGPMDAILYLIDGIDKS